MLVGLEEQHGAGRFLGELVGGVSVQPLPQPMMLVSPQDD
jgi:hypothetical protein